MNSRCPILAENRQYCLRFYFTEVIEIDIYLFIEIQEIFTKLLLCAWHSRVFKIMEF